MQLVVSFFFCYVPFCRKYSDGYFKPLSVTWHFHIIYVVRLVCSAPSDLKICRRKTEVDIIPTAAAVVEEGCTKQLQVFLSYELSQNNCGSPVNFGLRPPNAKVPPAIFGWGSLIMQRFPGNISAKPPLTQGIPSNALRLHVAVLLHAYLGYYTDTPTCIPPPIKHNKSNYKQNTSIFLEFNTRCQTFTQQCLTL